MTITYLKDLKLYHARIRGIGIYTPSRLEAIKLITNLWTAQSGAQSIQKFYA
jgi:hypothetical protein